MSSHYHSFLQNIKDYALALIMDIEQISYTKFRMHLASFIDKVAKTNLPILIIRRNNEPAYLVSKEMYEHLVKQNFSKSKTDKDTAAMPIKIKSTQQKPVQAAATTQQDLFN